MATTAPHNILQAWQRIEFFQPYSVEKKDNSLLISLKQLESAGDNVLPWLCERLRKEHEIPDRVTYAVHIGLFEKSLANKISQGVFGPDADNLKEELEQRLDQEGITCFAKILLSTDGAPALDKFSVSSLPWALGHLKEKRFSSLCSEIFTADCQHLADALSSFQSTLKPVHENGSGVLRAENILTLLHSHLTQWADFVPPWEYVLQIDWSERNGDIAQDSAEVENEDEEEPSLNDKALKLPILNSFYFEDLERAIAGLKRGDKSKALRTYLSGKSTRKEPSLYSPEGLTAIINNLHPSKMPAGRWPSEPEHAMTLMQQFAINTAIEELDEGGILSVNGPPGTGKTTLLRDLVAHNIVERARRLSRFNRIDETLDKEGFIVPELTGFEMVIASSNNAAVENISKELPQKKFIAEEFCTLDYLAPTANQLAAENLPKSARKKGKNREGKERDYHFFRPLEQEKQCWGMISAALGKKANRTRFGQRLLMNEHFLRGTPSEKSRPENENFLSLWRWKSLQSKLSFADAQTHFRDCLQQTEVIKADLIRYAALLRLRTTPVDENILSDLEKAKQQCLALSSNLANIERNQQKNNVELTLAEEEESRLKLKKFGWFAHLFNRKELQEHRQSEDNNRQRLEKLVALKEKNARDITEGNKQLADARQKAQELEKQIKNIQQQKEREHIELQKLQQRYPDISLPDDQKDISDATVQRTAYWQNTVINRQRSALFIAAMELHKAWLYEALGKIEFRRKLMSLYGFLDKPHLESSPLRWWQLLCMFVPVISTTFASVGRMLHGVNGNELGWLMIDEAGQASPLQAVGAIWRAKRVLVVGDPLQIEPVFTTSPALVERICQDALDNHADDWNPGKISVQQVADRANHWGCALEVMGNEEWIGIPLWVHRRCNEPMFSLANKMAYNNRMIHGLNAEKIRSKPVNGVLNNQWLISVGGLAKKQYRDSHGKSLIVLLERLLAENVALSSIYVITPFKAVKAELLELLKKRDLRTWNKYAPWLKRSDIDKWQQQCIGTVHTFQGKENDIVIFVLGCDKDNNGGASWAASKPNLLNVALTRAKKNIFVIGDLTVWETLQWFDDVAATLPAALPESIAEPASEDTLLL